jgi:hypothetical protein
MLYPSSTTSIQAIQKCSTFPEYPKWFGASNLAHCIPRSSLEREYVFWSQLNQNRMDISAFILNPERFTPSHES